MEKRKKDLLTKGDMRGLVAKWRTIKQLLEMRRAELDEEIAEVNVKIYLYSNSYTLNGQ